MITIKKKAVNIFHDHDVAISIFIFEILYQFIVTNKLKLWKVDFITYAYHAVDFKMGFCTKLLPGAIYGTVFSEYSYILISLWETILFLVFVAIISFLIEKVYLCFDSNNNYIKLFLLLLLAGPFTLSIFIVEFGMLDVYWFYFTIIVICLMSSRKSVLFSLPIAFFIVLVHYSSMLCYIPLVVLLLLYKSVVSNDKSEKRIYTITSVLFAIIAILTSIYFLLFDSSNLKLSMEEFNETLNSRGADYHTYYDYAFYRETSGYGFEYVQTGNVKLNFINTLLQQIKLNLSLIEPDVGVLGIIFTFPIVFLVFYFYVSIIKDKNEKLNKKIVLFLMSAMFPTAFLGGCVFSTDIVRWYSHAFICLLISFIFVLNCNKKTANKNSIVLSSLVAKIPSPIIESYCLIYFLMTFEVYS